SYAFLAAYRDLGHEDAAFSPETCPVISCNLTEGELPAIGESGKGHLSVGPYFAPRPAAFASSFEASAYASVQVMADVLSSNPDAGPAEFSKAFAERRFSTRLGPIAIDAHSQHATLPVIIGRIADGFFEVVSREDEVAPDPYLSRYDPAKTFGRPRLRVVS
ncbi:transporter substrate-binding protein, partial [Mesorhizobium sp. M7A.F.Ca.CA.001.06.1.1]